MEASQATALRAGPLAPVWRVLGDEQLARAAGGGNDHAFAALYARYRPVLRAYCASILLDQTDADDAVQATMIKAMRALPARNEKLPLRPWLYRIAHNESVDLLRRRRSHAPEDALDTVFVPGPEVDLARRERLAELVADLRSLPERQGAALIMRELSGLTYEEIAQSLQVTPGGARQAVFEARSALHDFERGRDVACATIQRSLSDGDRRRWRTRSVRAHLRACQDCRSFEHAITRRGEDLALLPPFVLNSAATLALAGGLLSGLAGTAGGGAAAPAVGVLASIAGGSAAKSLAGAAAAVAVGGATLGGTLVPTRDHQPPAKRATATVISAAAAPTPVVVRRTVVLAPRTPASNSNAVLRARSHAPARHRVASVRVPALDVVRAPVQAVTKTVSDVTSEVQRSTEAAQEAARRAAEQAQKATQQARDAYTQGMNRAAEATRRAMEMAQQWQEVAQKAAGQWQATPAGTSGRTHTEQADIVQQVVTTAQQTVSTTLNGVQQLLKRLVQPR
jgi:RNA polymerase sigma factor (sigma-70 family)